MLEFHGYDAGVSFRTLHHRTTATTATVLSNTGHGVRAFGELMDRAVRA